MARAPTCTAATEASCSGAFWPALRSVSSLCLTQCTAAGLQQTRRSAARGVCAAPRRSARGARRGGRSRRLRSDSSVGAARGYYHSLGFLLALNTKQITPAPPPASVSLSACVSSNPQTSQPHTRQPLSHGSLPLLPGGGFTTLWSAVTLFLADFQTKPSCLWREILHPLHPQKPLIRSALLPSFVDGLAMLRMYKACV